MFLAPRREHIDVLHHPRVRASIGAGAMRQRLMPDDQIAGAPSDRPRFQGVEILAAWVGAGRQLFEPGFAPALEAGDQRECALLGRRVGKVEDAAGAERDRRFHADIPVQMRAGKFPTFPLRHIEADAVGGRP